MKIRETSKRYFVLRGRCGLYQIFSMIYFMCGLCVCVWLSVIEISFFFVRGIIGVVVD